MAEIPADPHDDDGTPSVAIPPEPLHGDGTPAAAGMPGPPGIGLTEEQLARSLAAGTFVDIVWVNGEPHDPKRRPPDQPLDPATGSE